MMTSKRVRSPIALALWAALAGATVSAAASLGGPAVAHASGEEGLVAAARELWTALSPGVDVDPRRSLAPIIKKVRPAVVTVFIQGMELPSPFGRALPMDGEAQGLGSGFLISSDGVVVTNHHVVAHGRKLTVRLDDGRRFDAKLLGSDEQTDIAVIKLEGAKNLPTVPLGSSTKLEVGDWVLAVGSPQGMLQTASVGIISAKGRGSLDLYGNGSYVDFVQTDAAISRGSSGGPLFDLDGRVIGVNTAVHGYANGLGFAVPVDQAKFVIPQLRDHGKVSRAWLGVSGRPEVAPAVGAPVVSAAVIERVHPGTPAAEAGLKDGDRVLSIDGERVENFADLRGRVGFTTPGTKVDLEVEREGQRKKLTVRLGRLPGEEQLSRLSGEGDASPPAAGKPSTPPGAGLWGGKAPKLGIGVEPGADGLVIRDVETGGLGEQLGLQSGDVLLKVNGQDVKSSADVRSALERDDKRVTVESRRGGATSVSSIQRW
jgi:serine protease Do